MSERTILPNTTQVPHIIFREWMPRLSDVELRVLLIVVDQTLGWIEDTETGRRKGRDWMSQSQLVEKTGRGRAQISLAVKKLADELHLIEAVDAKGKMLPAEKRKKNFGKIFYQLNLHAPALTLFDKKRPNKAESSRVRNSDTEASRVQISGTRNSDTTKETHLQKEIPCESAEPIAPREKSPHAKFMDFWYEMVEKTRGFKPKISGADGMNLKRVLATGIDPETLEKIAVYFLADPGFKTFSPTLSTMLSAGILNGLLNRTKNDPEFYRNLNQYADRFLPRKAIKPANEVRVAAALNTLLHKFQMPGSRENSYEHRR